MPNWKALVTRVLPEAGMRLMREACALRVWEEDRPIPRLTLSDWARGMDGIACLLSDPLDAEVIAAAGPGLKVIATMAVGYDNIDLPEATRRGIVVGNTPGVLTEATADLAWALLLALGRRVVEGDRLVRSGRWTGWGPTQLVGADLAGRVLGIVGLGRIGKRMAHVSRNVFKRVIACDPYIIDGDFPAYVERRSLALVFAESNVVSLHVPLNAETRGMIDAKVLAGANPGTFLVNTARGAVVDVDAAIKALDAGGLAGLALDVLPAEPVPAGSRLLNHPRVILTPHAAFFSVEAERELRRKAAQNIVTWLATGRPDYVVVAGTRRP